MSRRKILVVEDDRDQRQAIGIRLRANGYDVAFAADGMQAVAGVRKERPDLVLLDIGLPGGDGFSVMQRIKSMSPSAGLPIIVMSARDAASNRELVLAAGAEAFLPKPTENQVLIASIRRALGESPEEPTAN
jgi:DNA-binding response OmpR family regulator